MATVGQDQLITKSYDQSRIFLKQLFPNDASSSYLGWLHDEEINKYLHLDSLPQSISDLSLYLADVQASPNTYMFGIYDKINMMHIGNIKLGGIDWKHLYGDVGLLIGEKKYWNKGFATEALTLLCEFAFNNLSLFKLIAGIHEENVASIKVFNKAGFKIEGSRMLQFVDRNGLRFSGLLLGLIQHEWKSNTLHS